MRKNLLSTLMCLVTFTMMASAQNYTFSKRTETYTPITGGTAITRNINLGFDVTIDGVKSSTLQTSQYYGQIGTKKPLQFSGFYAEVQDGSQTYTITGNAGDRIVKLQYQNVVFSHDQSNGDYVNFQIWIYEKDNALELHMGTSRVNYPTLDYYYNIPKGPGIGFKNMWLAGSPANPTIDTAVDAYLNGTPTNGQVYRFAPATTSIANTTKTQSNISLYPNPGNGIFSITVTKAEQHIITVYDMLQRKILQQPLDKEINTINISKLHAGNYTIQVSDNNQVLKTFKYLKQ